MEIKTDFFVSKEQEYAMKSLNKRSETAEQKRKT